MQRLGTKMEKVIESLFSPLTRDDFISAYRESRPIAAHHDIDKFKELTSLKYLSSFTSLLESWPTTVNAYSPGIPDEVNSTKVSTKEAEKLFQQGSGLFFDDPNKYEEVLGKVLEGLRQDLGLSNLTYSRSLIYAIPKGKGTAPHFDQNINFVLQISGTKKWWVAKNTAVENPMTRYTIGTNPDAELDSYLDEDLPTAFPEDFTEHELRPGSVLFLPRGTWHKTEATEHAVSLNFTFSAPTWIDILQTALRSRLSQSSFWRGTANFTTDVELHTEAISMFDTLLDQLKQDVPSWQARDILRALETEPE
jgi:50S ribosomal protein L16 3-hydroxylase